MGYFLRCIASRNARKVAMTPLTTPFQLSCIVCGYPVSWHRDPADNHTLTCVELMLAYGPKTHPDIREWLRRSADEKRKRGLDRLAKHNARKPKTPKKRSKRTK